MNYWLIRRIDPYSLIRKSEVINQQLYRLLQSNKNFPRGRADFSSLLAIVANKFYFTTHRNPNFQYSAAKFLWILEFLVLFCALWVFCSHSKKYEERFRSDWELFQRKSGQLPFAIGTLQAYELSLESMALFNCIAVYRNSGTWYSLQDYNTMYIQHISES